MVIDVTYQCRRKQTQTYPIKATRTKKVFKNFIVYDPKTPDIAFSDKCETCGFGRGGVNMMTGATFILCKITRIDGINKQTTEGDVNI